MRLEVATLSELLPTDLALERTLASVTADVNFERA